MTREIKSLPAVVKLIPADNITDLKDWLQIQATAYSLIYMLAHADDGVIWGRMNGGQLETSNDAVPSISPPLRLKTLQSVRLFSAQGELLLWRVEEIRYRSRLIHNLQGGETSDWDEAFDEPQLLWGTPDEQLPNGFTLLRDGAQGLRHAVPLQLALNRAINPRLIVRHYLTKENFARVAASRLVNIEA
ncbi:MAG TPA: CRISPR-associated protein Csx19 [Blastocatellia bacterium]|nr:CRISPR-associated protein Csx19 [Blastocatellia bacterium]